jgi:shikimate kinase
MRGHIWLIGMMGAGKTAVGRELASRLGLDFADTDAEVVARTGCSIAHLWGERGEAAFRDMERAALRHLADRDPAVIATGGGAVLDPDNVATMRRSGLVVWLTATDATLARRVGDATTRPLLDAGDSRAQLAAILEERLPDYTNAAHHAVSTEGVTTAEVAAIIEALWNAS